ncbi:MAG: RdgB/HAM1 family non-canonical purine NTP pyrophosphatase [Ruminococcaceae bacterium]|nr:RdgB/HAM1 family non-canonical purine NTP pyrophosphatase [Oscillospiraceae bacterium]
MKIVLASRNKHKIGELQALLGKHVEGVEILSLDDVGFTDEIVEDGSSFEENALIKARAAASTGYIGVGDDSGLSVNALGGAPGIYSARYAGEHGDDAANNTLLLENLKDKSDRSAEFVCAFACVFPDGREICVRGATAGVIIDEYRGNGGFGYDPLFLYEPMGKTFSEMSAEEKNSISHRGKAIEAFAEKLLTI